MSSIVLSLGPLPVDWYLTSSDLIVLGGPFSEVGDFGEAAVDEAADDRRGVVCSLFAFDVVLLLCVVVAITQSQLP